MWPTWSSSARRPSRSPPPGCSACYSSNRVEEVRTTRLNSSGRSTRYITREMHPGNNLTRDEARRRAELIQTPLYDISLDLTRDSDTFACEATIHFLCQEPGANSFIDFLAPSVDSCELNGEEVPKEAV